MFLPRKGLTYASLPGTMSKQMNLTTLEGSHKLDGRRRPYRAPGGAAGTAEEKSEINMMGPTLFCQPVLCL